MTFPCGGCTRSFPTLRGLGVHRGRGGYCRGPDRESVVVLGKRRQTEPPDDGAEDNDHISLWNPGEGIPNERLSILRSTNNRALQPMDDVERAVDLPPFPCNKECGKYLALQLANKNKATGSLPRLAPLVTAELEFLALVHRW